MAARYLALLRGINVGKAKRIAMADLRALFEGLGYTDVATLLNSGNVVFTGRGTMPGAAARIEKAMVAELAVAARVMIISAVQLEAIMDANPLGDIATNHSRLLVAFVRTPADLEQLRPLLALESDSERFAVGTHAAYLWCSDGILESRIATAMLTKRYADIVTSRNWATVSKLALLLQER